VSEYGRGEGTVRNGARHKGGYWGKEWGGGQTVLLPMQGHSPVPDSLSPLPLTFSHTQNTLGFSFFSW
jgi:hypothetical protein